MRPNLALILLLHLALPGCGTTLPDALLGGATGRDCSALHLQQGLPYCLAPAAPPAPPPFCTRSRGAVDCWQEPPPALPAQRGLADTPAPPPPERQSRPWPRLGFAP